MGYSSPIMTRKAFEGIMAGLNDALAYTRGDKSRVARVVRIRAVDVKAVRRKTGLSQHEFAAVFGVPFDTLCKWEQGTRAPAGASRLLLHVIGQEPRRVMKIARTVQQVENRRHVRAG
jgi:putative transcriptional regulator